MDLLDYSYPVQGNPIAEGLVVCGGALLPPICDLREMRTEATVKVCRIEMACSTGASKGESGLGTEVRCEEVIAYDCCRGDPIDI